MGIIFLNAPLTNLPQIVKIYSPYNWYYKVELNNLTQTGEHIISKKYVKLWI